MDMNVKAVVEELKKLRQENSKLKSAISCMKYKTTAAELREYVKTLDETYNGQ